MHIFPLPKATSRSRSVLKRLCQMCGLNLFAPRQVRHRVHQLQDVVIGSCRQIELTRARHDVAARIRPRCIVFSDRDPGLFTHIVTWLSNGGIQK